MSEDLLAFLYGSPTALHVVCNLEKIFRSASFSKLDICDKWYLKPQSKYYITSGGTSFFAFITGDNKSLTGFDITGTHTDSPGIRIKPNAEMFAEGFLMLNTEVYGGPLLYTWFDRPLSIAGRAVCKGTNSLSPKSVLVNISKPVAIIPSLAIHMNRDVNTNGLQVNNQKDLLPVIMNAVKGFEKDKFLLRLLSSETGIPLEDILDFELFLYEYQKPGYAGINNEFISASRIDDLEAVYAGAVALSGAAPCPGRMKVLACFDSEEIGSATAQGADSQMLSNILERIVMASGGTREDFLRCIPGSFMVSVDGAHSVHPNRSDKADPINRPVINAGPVIKLSSNKRYTSDAESVSIIRGIAEKASVPVQVFVNNSNEKGGSTIGPISSTHLEMKSVDIGVPMLAMHSIRELSGTADHENMIKLLRCFYGIHS